MSTEAAPAPVGGATTPSLAESLGGVVVGARRDLVVTRQIVRGDPQYVVHDPVAFCNHALTALEYRILCSIGSRQTLSESLDELIAAEILSPEDREEFYEFVLGLHGMGLLVVPGMPSDLVWRRHEERREARRRGVLRYLVSLRVPLGNPDRWLHRALPYVRWLFTKAGFLLWAGLLAAALWQCGGRLGELYGSAADLLALHNLPILWLALVGLKGLHELGHAFAIKRYGGVVPDFGVIFIFLTPCAYVDANASWTFANRWPRIVVGLGGMYVETLIAFVFALIWSGTQPGLLHDVAQSVVVLATLTTVLININPLIKFDGYYVFSDLVGIFNLQERANRNLRSTAESVLLGTPRAQEEHTRLERFLIWFYAPASMLYRISLAFGITMLMLTTWPTIGVPLGLAFAWMLILDPLRKMFRYLWTGERLEAVRLRARIVAVLTILIAVVAAALVPVSRSVIAPGVLDPGLRRSVRAPSSAFVETIDVADGQVVAGGSRLCQLRDPKLEERVMELESELAAARVEFDATEILEPNVAATLAARIEFLEGRSAELRARADALDLRMAASGTVVGARTVVPGQFVHQGEELLQIHSEHRFVRVVMTDREVARTRLEVGSVAELRWGSDPGNRVEAVVREIRRSASRYRVPVELTVAAGGEIYARDTGNEIEADQPYLHVFLQADSVPLEAAGSGLTAQVRFDAREETLGGWMKRRLLTFFYNWRTG